MNKNEIKFLGKIWVDIEYNSETTKLPTLITQRNNITPLLCVKWLKQLSFTINVSLLDEPTNQSNTILTKFHNLFETNHTIKNLVVKIRIKPGCYPIQQKDKLVPYLHLCAGVKDVETRCEKWV